MMTPIRMVAVELMILMMSIFEVVDRCQNRLESGRLKTKCDRLED